MNFSQFMTLSAFGNLIGIAGMICCLLAFFIVQKSNPNMVIYNVLNMLAAVFLFISLCIHPNVASMCLEVCWFSIAVYGLVKIWLNKTNKKMSGKRK